MPLVTTRSLILVCLAPALLLGGEPESLMAARDQSLVQDLAPTLGLGRDDTLRVGRIVPDPLMQGHSTRLQQYYRGVRVLGGEGIAHLSGPRNRSVTDAFVKGLDLDTQPSIQPSEALAKVTTDPAMAGPWRVPPTVDLRVVRLPKGDALAYHVHLEKEGGTGQTSHMDYLVHAQTGEILRSWSSLRTGRGATGKGYSQYSGTVTLNTTRQQKGDGYELRDWTRGRTGNVTLDLKHQIGESDGAIFTSASNNWGDGNNYAGGVTTTPNGETAGVDAAYGLQVAWDFFSKVLGRKGVDDKGTAVTMRVHYDRDYDNAFWSDSCFCITIGDGCYFKSLDSLDVIGHELAHGVCSNTANLDYYGESGGLNEANSDIMGTLIEYYARGGSDSLIGSWGGNWTIGEDVAKPEHPAPIRYMYKPSKDGASADVWSPDLEFMNPHMSSGPMNRCFYFLSQGASPTRTSDYYSCLLPKGMEGLGNDRAAKIWYRALSHYLTSQSGYADARKACICSAKDLFGAASPEEQAVWNAFRAVNVGPAWKN